MLKEFLGYLTNLDKCLFNCPGFFFVVVAVVVVVTVGLFGLIVYFYSFWNPNTQNSLSIFATT